jgi:hypothetical protein
MCKTIIYFIAMQTYKELIKSHIISTDEDPGLRIESFAVINLRGVSTNKTIIPEQYKEKFDVSSKGPSTNFLTKGIRSKRRISPCVVQVVAKFHWLASIYSSPVNLRIDFQ